MKENRTKEAFDSRSGTIMVYLTAVLFVALGIAFLAIPNLAAEQFCYLLAGGLILLGILRIGEYFIRESYKNVNQYGFSVGVFAIILGVCVIIRIQQFAGIFHICLGIGILLTSIIKVQHAMDLYALGDRRFPVFLGPALILVICGAVILVNPFSKETLRDHFTYVVLIVDGGFSLLSTTYLVLRTRKLNRESLGEGTAEKTEEFFGNGEGNVSERFQDHEQE